MRRHILFYLTFALIMATSGCKVFPVPNDYTFEGGLQTQSGKPQGGQDVLVIFVRASDDNTPNLDNLRSSEQAEFTSVSNFFAESSFSQLSFNYDFGPQNNWYQLSKTYDDYFWTQADINRAPVGSSARKQAEDGLDCAQGYGLIIEAMQKAQDNNYNIADYDQIVIVSIGPFLRGESHWPLTFTLKDSNGKPFQVTTTVLIVSTKKDWSRTAHEFGHAFGHFADSYYSPVRRPEDWDIMDCTDCGAQTPGWNKDHQATWYMGQHASKLKVIARPTGLDQIVDETILVPYETQNAPAGSIQTLRLDVGAGIHLYVENRQKINGQTGSQQLPGSGIIITDAMDDMKTINVHRDPIQLYGGPIMPGSSFVDQAYGNLKIEVSGTAPNLKVRTTWGPDPYADLSITPWFAPPWESPDIWVDSPVNGWDFYEYNDLSINPSVPGNPVRNGDRPLVSYNNHLYARVTNTGNSVMNNVQVSFFVSDPPGIGQEDANWALIERKTIGTVKGGQSVVTPKVNFVPKTSAHTCIRVVIDYQPGELNANNNMAHENIFDFNTTAASPWKPVESTLLVVNPFDKYKDIIMEMRGLPKDWKGWVSDRVITLEPKGSKLIKYRIDPSLVSLREVGRSVDIDIVGYIPNDKNQVPLGGVTSVVHLVEQSSVSIDISGTGNIRELNNLIAQVYYQPKTDGIPIALGIKEAITGRSSMYSTLTNASGHTDFNIGNLISSGHLMRLEPGKKYIFQVFLYGNKKVDASSSAEAVVNILS